MLFNTTLSSPHGRSCSIRTCPSLLETYIRYKQDTRAIITWLISHGTGKNACLQTVSIRDLLKLAETVQRKAVVMPDTIGYHFREAIAARTQLSKSFRRECIPGVDDEETLKHEYFTMSLIKMYTSLCECCNKEMKSCKRHNRNCPPKDSGGSYPNRFEILHGGAGDGHSTPTEEEPNGQCDECSRENWVPNTPVKATPRLVDDQLGDVFELLQEVQEMSQLRLATISVWEQASRGEIPLVLAAFITNATFSAFEEIERRLPELCGGSNPQSLRSKVTQMEEDFKVSGGNGLSMDSSEIEQIEALQKAWHLLLQFKCGHRDDHCDKKCRPIQKPSHVILRQGSDSDSTDHECLTMMLSNIEQHVQASRPPTYIVRQGTPLYADIGYFSTHGESDTNGLRCSYGLKMLLETYKSYFLASQPHCSTPSCRLQALKFAQEAITDIRAVLEDSTMPCRCCCTLAFHLENVQSDFTAFLEQKVWDLYFQSPWVCGSHILEMLELLFYYGLRLFSYRHYVGSVVHVYNVLREVTGFQPIPLLEELCCQFAGILFPGGRPTRNFKACCFRFMGGRLRFNSHASDHRSGSHQLAIPTHTAKATAGFSLRKEANDARFEYNKVSLFHHIKERGYYLDNALWKQIYERIGTDMQEDAPSRSRTATKRRPFRCSQHTNRETHHSTSTSSISSSSSSQSRLHHLQTALLPEITGPFPIAKINFFQIYLCCVRIIRIISDRTHQQDGDNKTTDIAKSRKRSDSENENQNFPCLCFLDTILVAADRFRESTQCHKPQPLGYKNLVENCGDAMRDVLGDRPLDDFLWKCV